MPEIYDDEVKSTPNGRGNWDVTIPNLGKQELLGQIDKLEKGMPFDDEVQALIDVLWNIYYSMQ